MSEFRELPVLGLFGSGAVRDESMPVVKSPKSALIVGYYGAGNAGDEAILNSVLWQLRTEIPDLLPFVVSDDPGSTSNRYAVESIGKNDKPALWKAVRDCQMIVLGGGGLLQDYWNVDLSSLFSEGTTFSYYAYAALASLFDKHLLLYAVGVGPLLSETGRRYTRMLAEQAQLILVRDQESKSLLTELGVNGARIHVTADPAFLASDQPWILDLPQPVLGVALRNWNIGINPEAWESQVTEALDVFLDRHPEGSIVFLPFQLSRSQGDDDEAIADRVRARMRHQTRTAVSQHSGDASSLGGIISRCDVVVGMRYHSVLFAIRTHVPVVGLVYDPKVRNLMASAGCGALALDLHLLRADDLAERIERAYTDADLKRRLAEAAAVLSLAAADNQRHIGDTFHAASPSTVLKWMDELSVAAVSANDKALELAIAERRSGISFPYDVICFPGIEWDFRWMRAQQLMSQFADNGHRVFFLSIGKTIRPGGGAFSLNYLRENVWEVLLRLPQPLDVYSGVLPDRLQDVIVEDLITLAGDLGIGRAVCMLHLPTWAPIADRLRAALGWPIAYDCMDDWSGFAWMPDSLVEQEVELVDGADLVIVSAQALWDKWAVRNAKTLLARNGADIAHFQCRIPAALPPIAIPPSRTVVGFFGAIDSWFDVELLAFAAAERPHYFFAIIGATYAAPVEKLSALTNVRLYGHQPYADLPACLRVFDVCIIPFKINAVTQATDPVKFYEYIAGGKPVVATRLPELESYREVTYLADGPEDFTRLLDTAVAQDDAKRRERRQAVARENSWAARYQIIDSALDKALSGKAEDPRIVFAYQTLSLGGVEVVLQTRVVELRRRGWRVLLLFLEELDGRVLFEHSGVEIRICRDDSQIAKGLAEFKPDWIVSIDTPAILPIARQFDPGVKLVYEVHSTYSHMLAPLVAKDLLTGVRGIIVPSRSLQTRVESLVSSREVPMEVVPNSLAPIFFEASEETETPSRPTVLWVGRIDSVKNWLAFLDIATQLRDRLDVEFHLISGGFGGRAELEQVASRIAATGLEERFHWLQAVAHRRMPALYRSVARSGGCLVSTSVDESFGLAVLEAMACRCPVVVPDIESLRDLVQQDETGHLYPIGNSAAACERIVAVLQGSEEQRQAITEKAFQTASHYAPGIATDRFLAVLRDWSLPPRAPEMPAEPARLIYIREAISQILAKKSKSSRTVIFPPSVRWEDEALNGRAKQWARAFAGRDCTVFYSDPQYVAANPEPFTEIEPGIFVGNVPVQAYDVVDAPIVFVDDGSARQLDFLHNPQVVYECPQSAAGSAEWLARSSVVITYSEEVGDTMADLRPDVMLVQESLSSWDEACSRLMDAIQSADPSDPARMRALLAWREGQVVKLEAQIRDRDRPAVNVLHSALAEQKRILAQRNEGIAFLRSELASRQHIIAARDEAIAFMRGEAAHFQERLRAAEKEIERLNGRSTLVEKETEAPFLKTGYTLPMDVRQESARRMKEGSSAGMGRQPGADSAEFLHLRQTVVELTRRTNQLEAANAALEESLRSATDQQKSLYQRLRSFYERWQDQLAEYRNQRAWKIMLYFRKAYDLVVRHGWNGRFRLLSSGTASLSEYELHFPDLWNYVPEFQTPVLTPGPDSSSVEPGIGTPQQKYDVIVLGIIDFDFRFQRPQQIAAQYARNGHRVFWVSPTRFLPLSSEKAFEAVLLRDNLWEIHLRGEQPDIYMGSLDPAMARTLTASLAELYRGWAVGDSIALAQLPFWRQVTLLLREAEGSIVVYDCMDDWDTFENIGEFNVYEEKKFVHECDVLVVTGQGLVEKFAGQGLKPLLARNGADYGFFAQAQTRNLLGAIPRPIVGYFGAIADWIDLDLVYAVAKARPQYSFVLIGQVFGRDTSALESLPNVFLLGNQNYERIPVFLAEFDACTIPFLLNQVTKATDPVKLYEYFSQGKPVVATDMAELAQCAGLLYIGYDPEDFAQKLDLALNESGDDLRQQRVDFAKQNNWAQRVDTIDAAVRNAFPLVSILIVTYNSADYVRPCFDSLRDTYPSYEVIVVDNHSEDSTVDIVKEYAATDPRIHLHCLSSNSGFAAGNNLAARESAGEYLILLNVDVMVTPGWIERLLRHLRKDTSIGLICPVTNFVANEAKINVDYTNFDEMRRFAMCLATKQKGRLVNLDVAALFCTAISRDLWQRIGELDEGFGMGMFEDDDFSMRVLKVGRRVVAAEDCFVHHFGQGSFSKLPSEQYDQIFDANRRRFEEKWKVAWKPHKTRANVRPAFEEKRFVPAEFYRPASSAPGKESGN